MAKIDPKKQELIQAQDLQVGLKQLKIASFPEKVKII